MLIKIMESGQFKIPKHIEDLNRIEKFTELFWQLCIDYGTYERAYEAAERIYISYFEKRRYKNYQSFRIARMRMQKNQL